MENKHLIEALAAIICAESSNRGHCVDCDFFKFDSCSHRDAARRIIAAGYAPVIHCENCERWKEGHICGYFSTYDLETGPQDILFVTHPESYCSNAMRRPKNADSEATAAPAL